METKATFDVIVIGGGHAAVEAALAPARMGLSVLMLTMDPARIGQMSCNPAVGGIAKGQAVRELDALGGEMARATDRAAMQFRMLNRGKGPAVWSPRAQVDRALYRDIMSATVAAQPGVTVQAGECVDIFVDNRGVAGVIDEKGGLWRAETVVLATGTFLKGLLHCGTDTSSGGRYGEPPAGRLSDALRRLGFEVGRLKTGTPMRLDGRSIDYSRCEIQPGDANPVPFSLSTRALPQKQLPCWLTHTTKAAHQAILDNLDRSPIYSGRVKVTGVRYCPSIEDKIVKFPHHERHHVFIEPEGYFTDEMYVNGLFTSLPPDAQEQMVHAIPGLEAARFTRYGYAVEYDFCPPTQLKPTLETKAVPGLFFAGQLNGTTGYEEAAGQGFVAGVNAALRCRGEDPFTLGRDEAFLGVMIDDLVTKGTDEPYRLLTSRAEYRLHLRWDNADLRLFERGRALGLVDDARYDAFRRYRDRVNTALSDRAALGSPMRDFGDMSADYADAAGDPLSAFDLTQGPWGPGAEAYQVWVQHKYGGYLERQADEIRRFRTWEARRIPDGIDFGAVPGLLLEAREKFTRVRPASVGQASRIPGVTPADIGVLVVHLRRRQGAGAA